MAQTIIEDNMLKISKKVPATRMVEFFFEKSYEILSCIEKIWYVFPRISRDFHFISTFSKNRENEFSRLISSTE